MMSIDGRLLALAVIAIAGGCIAGYAAFSKDAHSLPNVAPIDRTAREGLWQDITTGEAVAALNNPAQGTQNDFALEDTAAAMNAMAPAAGEPVISAPAAETSLVENRCEFDHWLNKEMNQGLVDEFVKLDRPYRILAPGSIYTQDYSVDRININIDEKGVVLDIWCG